MKSNALILAVSIILVMTGCKTKKEVVTKYVETHDTLVIERELVDTIIHVEPDTAKTRLLVECDEHNNALVSIVNELSGDKTSLESLIRYYEDKDVATGEKHRKAIVDIMAVVQAQDEEIKILKEKLSSSSSSTINEDSKEESEPAYGGLWSYLFAFLLGAAGAFVAVITIKK